MANRWMKRYSTSLIKSTVSYHFTPVGMAVIKMMNVGEDVERESLYTVGRDGKLVLPMENSIGCSSKI